MKDRPCTKHKTPLITRNYLSKKTYALICNALQAKKDALWISKFYY